MNVARRPWIDRLLPAMTWIRSYNREWLRADLISGVTTAIMLIPQGVAYALLTGLPAEVGLYASTVPLVFYAMFGTSRQLAVGPVAIVSLLTVATLTPIATEMGYAIGGAEYVGMAATLMMMVGVISLLMGALRLGFLTNFMSHPVILGFTFAAALIIGLGEVKNLLGIDVHTGKEFVELLGVTVGSPGESHWI